MLEVYPFWQVPDGQSVTVRFLPDAESSNPLGFIDTYYYHIIEVDGKKTKALCSEAHQPNQPCLYCREGRKAFRKNRAMAPVNAGARLYRKRMFAGNVIIMDDPLDIVNEDAPETYQILMSLPLYRELNQQMPSLKHDPSDFIYGRNFKISATIVHQRYKQYTGSFCRPQKLTNDQADLASRSLVDLSELRPLKYSSEFQEEMSKVCMWNILSTND